MNKQERKVTLGSMLRRALALVLVLSLVVIPVQFPGVSNAVEQTELNTIFSEDFSAEKEEGVKYNWNTSFTHPNLFAMDISGGKLNFYASSTGSTGTAVYSNYVYLSGMKDGEDVTRNWSNYTATFDLMLDPKTAGIQENMVAVVVYMDDQGQGYGVYVDGRNEMYMNQYYRDANGKLVRNDTNRKYLGQCYPGTVHRVTITVTNVQSGESFVNKVSAKVERLGADGVTFVSSNAITFSAEQFIAGGGVGLIGYTRQGYDNGYNTLYNHTVDNVTVTTTDGNVLFKEDFSDNRTMEGSVDGWNTTDVYETGDIYRFKQVSFTEEPGYNTIKYTGASVKDGRYNFYSNYGMSSNHYAAFYQEKDANGEYVIPQWENVSVTATNIQFSGGLDKYVEGAAIYGRVSCDPDTGKYSYYMVLKYGARVAIEKFVNGTRTELLGETGASGGNITATFITEGDSVVITAFNAAGGVMATYTDTTDPLGKGGVGIGYYSLKSNRDHYYYVSYDNLKVTDAEGAVLIDEEFDAVQSFAQKGKTPDYQWNVVEDDGVKDIDRVVSRWKMSSTFTNVYGVKFDNPAEGTSSNFRMDLDMKINGQDVSSFLHDYMFQFRTWLGSSNTPTSMTGSYAGTTPYKPLQTGALVRLMPAVDENGDPILDAQGNQEYTYYRVRQSGNYIYVEKRWHNPENDAFEIVELGKVKLTGYQVANEDLWYVFQITVSGNTISLRRPRARADARPDIWGDYTANNLSLKVVDDGTYGAAYTCGGVALWAQADYIDPATLAEGQSLDDMNVLFDEVKIHNWDFNLLFNDDFDKTDYLTAPAPGADSFYLFNNYAYTDDSAYTVESKVAVEGENWNVVDGALVKVTDAGVFHYMDRHFNGKNDAFGWENYGVDAKFQLVEGGYAGIVLFYNGTTGYELRFDGAKASLYKITNDTVAATPMKQINQTLTIGEMISVSVKIVGNVLTYTIGGESKTLAITDKAPFTAGTVGFDASAGVKFDDVKVYSLGAAPIFNVLDGHVYCSNLDVVVTDDDLVSVTQNGVEVPLKSGNQLPTIDQTDDYTLVATDEQGHVTTVSFTVRNTNHIYADMIRAYARTNDFYHGSYCILCEAKNPDVTAHQVSGHGAKTCKTTGCTVSFAQASYNGTAYGYIQDALNAAYTKYIETGVEQEVKLLTTLSARGLEIREGIILDLAGYHLIARGFDCFGQVVDSGRQVTEGEGTTTVYGGLRVHSTEQTVPNLVGNKVVPLLDAATGFYRFNMNYNFENLGFKVDGEYTKFGIRLTMDDVKAYDMLLDSGLTLAFRISWTGLEQDLFYVFNNKTVENYIEKVKAKQEAGEDITTALVLKVREFEKINGGQPGEFTITPYFMTDANSKLFTLDSTMVLVNAQ